MKFNDEGLNAKYLELLEQYKCHTVVRAGKIAMMAADQPNGQLMIHCEPSLMPIAVPLDFLHRHAPERGGYLVVYEDGYLSYSPAEPFESGYHKLELGSSSGGAGGEAPVQLETDMPPHQLRVLEELAQLGVRLQALHVFIGDENSKFGSLSDEEQGLLRDQAIHMSQYQDVLMRRVAAFS